MAEYESQHSPAESAFQVPIDEPYVGPSAHREHGIDSRYNRLITARSRRRIFSTSRLFPPHGNDVIANVPPTTRPMTT